MADIKTRDTVKGTIKTLDKAAIAGQKMKQAYIATKDKAEHSVNAKENTAEEYAADKTEAGIDEIAHKGAYTQVSAEVEAYDPLIRQYAKQYGIPEYVELIKAVMMQESGGRGLDPMQAAEGSFNTKYPHEPTDSGST